MSFLLVIIILALVFDYINGFHDAANSIATVVSTKVLTPFQAVLWAAFFNCVAFFIFKDHAVANTISKTVQKDFITLPVIFSGLIAAIFWNLLTWWYGIPSSSSHTLIGGFAGAAVTHAFLTKGMMPLAAIVDSAKILKTVAFIFIAPLLGMAISMFFTLLFVNQRTWLKVAILLGLCVGTWFVFQNFQKNKINENLGKYFKVEKYNKEIERLALKQEDDISKNVTAGLMAKTEEELKKNEGRLEDAKKIMLAVDTIASQYEKTSGADVAKNILKTADLKEHTLNRITDKLKTYLKIEQLKAQIATEPSKKESYESALAAYDSLKPITKKYMEIGADSMNNLLLAKYPISDKEEADKFKSSLNVNVGSEIEKELAKCDNKVLRYGIIACFLLFALSFIYIEKMCAPSAARTGNMFKKLQLLSSAAFSIGHGGNDAQKVMGIIGAAMIANGTLGDFKDLPNWVPISCYLAIGLGTLSGGWKIVKTMGSKITKVTPLEGVCAETAGAATLFLTEQMGIPVSTTHTITGSIIGVGAAKRLSAVRWGVTINLVWAWILTIPVSATLAAIVYWIVSQFVK
jgi:inorganic phosphate transporter, PiT family